jgi:DNA polymerase-3 subunit delta'
MFENLVFKDEVKLFLKNELKQNKKAATYLFYGDEGVDLLEVATSFTMGLNCSELEYDYCGVCEVCKKISHQNYADLEIIGLTEKESQVGIDKIKDTIYKASTSSYEGRKKVFIIKDIESLNRYSANALLKIIEEPPKGTFFILLSNTLNVLPTILSRSIVLKIAKPSAVDLGVTPEVYDFFMGNMKDIILWKEGREDIEIMKSYSSLGEYLKKYLEESTLETKIDLFRSIDDFIYNRKNINKIERLKLVGSISSTLQDDKIIENKTHERKILEKLMYFFIVRLKLPQKTEKLISLKQGLRSNTNAQLTLTLFFLNI